MYIFTPIADKQKKHEIHFTSFNKTNISWLGSPRRMIAKLVSKHYLVPFKILDNHNNKLIPLPPTDEAFWHVLPQVPGGSG